jgi:hypothetical protein
MDPRNRRHRNIVAITVCVAASFVSLSARGQSFDVISKPYDVARSLLIRSGFEPIKLKHDESVDLFCGDDFCKLNPEVLNCAGTGLNPCMFVYLSKNKKGYFIVDTHGEARLTVTGTHWARDYEVKDIQQRK